MKMSRYHTVTEVIDIPETISGFKGWEFSSGTTTGVDFTIFYRLFIQSIKRSLPAGTKLVNASKNHYCLSGFVQRENKFVYFSISDVRHFPEKWHKEILIRTAEHDKDYTGGSNGYTTLENFAREVERMLGTDQPSLLRVGG